MKIRINSLLCKLIKRYADNRPIKAIHHQGGLYLKRYYVTTIGEYWRVYLHNFVQSDPDGLHSHPWRWGFSIVLTGWYYEERRYGLQKIRWINFVGGNTFHRVHKVEGVECWTLFFNSPRIMNWGFIRNKGIFKQYVEVGKNNPKPLSDWYKTALKGKEWEQLQKH